MPRHPEVITEIFDTASQYKLEDPQPESIPGSSVSRAIYYHLNSRELWLAQSPAQEIAKLNLQILLREKIPIDIYAYYGVLTPRLTMAELPCHYPEESLARSLSRKTNTN